MATARQLDCLLAARWLLLAAAACVALASPAAGEKRESPAELLESRGLKRIDRVWVVPLEIELRRDLAALLQRRERIVTLEGQLDERIARNYKAWQESRGAIAALQQSLARLSTDDPQRAFLQRQIAAAESAAVEPAELGGKGDVRKQIIAWSAERNSLAAALVRIRQTITDLAVRYAELASDAELAAAIRQVGGGQRLGPRRNYQSDSQNLAEYERLVYTPWIPVHWQSGHVRFTGLANDSSPITFAWIETSDQPTLLTHSAAETIGLVIPAHAPQEAVSLTKDRRVTARHVTIPYLRFGACLLKDVPVLVLPPEAEDWGSRLGRTALTGHSLRLEPERLRAWIEG
jgi:hypothetical protein